MIVHSESSGPWFWLPPRQCAAVVRDVMDQRLYVRTELPATRDGICDPVGEVVSRLSVLADLLEGRVSRGAEYLAYDLLATTAWLERVRPEVLESLDPDDLAGQSRRRLGSEGKTLAEMAMRVPHPDGWVAEAEGLRASYESPIEPMEHVELASRILKDLDDAELVRCSLSRLGLRDSELDRCLDRCRAWFAENADAFLAAGVFVQALGQGLRPDLPQLDPDLARTADKIIWVLDALEGLEADLAFEGVAPIEPEALSPLFEIFASGHPLVDLGLDAEEALRTATIEPEPLLASYPFQAREIFSHSVVHLAAQGGEPEFELNACEWRSPDGRFLALLHLFSAPTSDRETVTIAFVDRHNRPAHELKGQVARLVNLSAPIKVGQNVVAPFTWGEPSQTGR